MQYEYDIFISYSSKDKEVISSLAKRLKEFGYKVWLDVWEIGVGDSIPEKIFKGLEKSRFIAIWLTQNSIISYWVVQEMEKKYHQGVTQRVTTVLPLLGEKCDIPYLLQNLKYADFSKNYEIGFNELLNAISQSSNMIIAEMKSNLLTASFPEESAKRLTEIVLARSDIDALEALWTSLLETESVPKIIDHCAWSIGKIICESRNSKVTDIALNYIFKSIESNSDLIIEKFAYTSYRVYTITNNKSISEKILSFIKSNVCSENQIVKRKYKYIINKHFN